MPTGRKPTTIVSTKGQVILPKAVRERRHWSAGTELVVEGKRVGLGVRRILDYTRTRPKDVFGSLPWKDKAKSDADMKAGIAAEAKRRHARHRY